MPIARARACDTGLEGIVHVVKIACLVFMLILAPASDAALGQEIHIAHQWADNFDGRDRAAKIFAQEVQVRLPAQKVRITPDSPLKPAQVLAALQSGKLDMAVLPLSQASAKVPEFALAGLPGLVPDLDAAGELKGSSMHAALQTIAQAQGVHILTWWWVPGGFFTKDLQIFGPSSVRGITMQATNPLIERMLSAAGASVIDVPPTELAAAMRFDKLDAIITTYESFMSLGLAEQAKFATIGSSLFMDFCPLVMSLTAWKKLTPEQRKAFEEAAAISERTLRRRGVAIWRMSHDDYLAWLALAQKTAWAEYARINPRAKQLLLETVRTVLVARSDKETLTDSLFGEDKKE
jgi:TRAP-type transport system periplasmic protein